MVERFAVDFQEGCDLAYYEVTRICVEPLMFTCSPYNNNRGALYMDMDIFCLLAIF